MRGVGKSFFRTAEGLFGRFMSPRDGTDGGFIGRMEKAFAATGFSWTGDGVFGRDAGSDGTVLVVRVIDVDSSEGLISEVQWEGIGVTVGGETRRLTVPTWEGSVEAVDAVD